MALSLSVPTITHEQAILARNELHRLAKAIGGPALRRAVLCAWADTKDVFLSVGRWPDA